MRRAFSMSKTLLTPEHLGTGTMTLLKDFNSWKLRESPNYSKLPINENPEYNIPVAVNNAVFSKVPVEPLIGNVRLVCVSEDALRDLFDLDPQVVESSKFVDFVTGKYLPEGGYTVCHRYGGYQFGYWADQLGDGRAHILGEYINRKGERYQPQLKGSGETPYSRFGDGRAVLRSSIREMLASEACYYLGVPTTRAAALVVSDDHKVWRDKAYSGAAKQERAAILLRIATSWFRIGSLEILNKRKEPELLRTLVDFIIEHDFPTIDANSKDKYSEWYSEVAHRNMDLVAAWQGFGFTHGVLNTDNVSLQGVTIDFGPYGFMDHYYEFFVPNSSDDAGRYSYQKQPEAMLWNLDKFYDAIEPVLDDGQKTKIAEIRSTHKTYMVDKILKTFLLKLGLTVREEDDEKLVKDLLQMMESKQADFTATFRQLSEVDAKDLLNEKILEQKWSLNKVRQDKDWEPWVRRYRDRLQIENISEEQRKEKMAEVNPLYVPRNWIMQEAIKKAENNDFEEVRFLLALFKKPFEVNEEADKRGYSSEPPSWAFGLKLSCSS